MLESSLIFGWLIRRVQKLEKLYEESQFSRLVAWLAQWLLGFILASAILSWFSKELKENKGESLGFFASTWRSLSEKVRKGIRHYVSPVIEGSLIFQLIDRIDLLLVTGCLLIGAMIVLPTSLSVLAAILVVVAYIYRYLCGKVEAKNHSPVFLLTGLFLVMILISSLSAFKGSDAGLIGTIYLTYIGAALTIGRTMNDDHHLNWYLTLIMTMTIMTCLYGAYQYIVGVEVDPAWVDEELFGTAQTRIYSVFGNPNVFGIYLVMMAPIAFALTLSLKHPLLKLISLGTLGLALGSIGLTWSRGSMLSVLIALAITLVLINVRFILLAIPGLALLPFVVPQSILDRFVSIVNLQDSSILYRLSMFQASLSMVKDYLWGGVGTGGFKQIYFAYAFEASKSFHAHNTFLMVFIEYGIIGFGLFMAILFLWARELISTALITENLKHKYLLLAFVGGITGASVQGMAEHIWHNYDVMFFYWLFILMGTGLAKLAKREVLGG